MRDILKYDFVIWVGRMLGQSSRGRDLGDWGELELIPTQGLRSYPFLSMLSACRASVASLLSSWLGIDRTVPAMRLGFPVQFAESSGALMVLGPYSTFVR